MAETKRKPRNPNTPWRRGPIVKRPVNYERMVEWGRLSPKPEKRNGR